MARVKRYLGILYSDSTYAAKLICTSIVPQKKMASIFVIIVRIVSLCDTFRIDENSIVEGLTTIIVCSATGNKIKALLFVKWLEE